MASSEAPSDAPVPEARELGFAAGDSEGISQETPPAAGDSQETPPVAEHPEEEQTEPTEIAVPQAAPLARDPGLAPKRRGRPPGARNKPKITKLPAQTPASRSPPQPEQTPSAGANPSSLPQTGFARPPPLMDPGEALMIYLQQQKQREREERIEMYSRLIRGRK